MTLEADRQQRIEDALHMFGWLYHHCRPAWTGKGYRTPIKGDAGFPDLCAVGHGMVLFIEVKGPTGRLSEEQKLWRVALTAVSVPDRLEYWLVDSEEAERQVTDLISGGRVLH